MHFPMDTADHSSRHAERQVYLPPVRGDSAIAVGADRDEWSITPTPALEPFNRPIVWDREDGAPPLSLADTERYIPIVERRLELNHALLVEYTNQLQAAERAVEADEKRSSAAYVQVERVMLDDDARFGSPQGIIMSHSIAIGPDVWVASRGCYLRDTREWKHFVSVKMHANEDVTKQKQERTRLQKLLDQEREMTGKLESRLYDLREHVKWWRREFESLA